MVEMARPPSLFKYPSVSIITIWLISLVLLVN